jgi:hypothetical protein
MVPKLLTLWLLLSAVPALGQSRTAPMAWEYDRTYTPPVIGFLLTAVDAQGTTQPFQVPLSLPGACDGLPDATADTFCTTVPCPAPGSTVEYWVQATVSETVYSMPSPSITCFFPAGGSACRCASTATNTPPPLPPTTPPPPPLPQRSAEGLNLLPIGSLPALAPVPSIPASGGTNPLTVAVPRHRKGDDDHTYTALERAGGRESRRVLSRDGSDVLCGDERVWHM